MSAEIMSGLIEIAKLLVALERAEKDEKTGHYYIYGYNLSFESDEAIRAYEHGLIDALDHIKNSLRKS